MSKKIKISKVFGGLIYAVRRYNQRRALSFKTFLKRVHEAEQKAALDGKRYRIYSFGGKYRVLSKEDINYMRNRNLLSSKVNVGVNDRFCLYDTLTHANLHPQFRDKDLNIEQYKTGTVSR